jgi:CDP-6-deoxy-D-xylo-4-hexulose-3-dehydrase
LEKKNSFRFQANKSDKFTPREDTVYYSGPYWSSDEIVAAFRSLVDGKWLSSGEQVMKFERAFSKKFAFEESVMVNSGSSANLVMIAALKKYFGWKDGDEVIVSAVGFPTTLNPLIQNNLKPVLVDIDFNDLNWNLEEISKSISSKTMAVFSSPVLGNPYNLDKLLEIIEGKNIQLISDNCDSLGSKWRDKFLTDYSVAASCSFYPAHHITTMEGGMVSSNNSDIVKIARSFAWWGRACYCVGTQNLLSDGTCKKRFSNWITDCDAIVDHKYVFENIGYNLKPLDLQGAIGIVQLRKFDEIDSLRKRNYELISRSIAKVPGCRVVEALPEASTSWFGVPIICQEASLKRKLVAFLEKNKIQTRNYFAGNILQQPAYGHLGNFRDFPEASKVLSQVFFLGCSPTITIEMISYIDSVIDEFVTTF